MDITNTTNVTSTDYQTAVEQESLSNEDFMNLLLTELAYQDPTEPMDTASMIDQTLQMSTIEANNSNIEALASMENSFASSQMMSSVNLIGKHIDTGDRTLNLENSTSSFSLLLDEDVSSGYINITDSNNELVSQLDISGLTAGQIAFVWDGLDTNEEQLEDGAYTLEVEAYNNDNSLIGANIATSLISSVEFDSGNILVVSNNYKTDLNNLSTIW